MLVQRTASWHSGRSTLISSNLGDLLYGSWVPVTWHGDAGTSVDDQRPALGLFELLVHAHEICSIEVSSPPALSALYRLLYALAARVSGLDDGGSDWEDLRESLIDVGQFDPDSVSAYFKRFPDRFMLFHHERPFLQDPRLSTQCSKTAGVNKLVSGRSAGNNHSWFGHHNDASPVAVSADQAFLDLLTWTYYGSSGRCSTRVTAKHTEANTKAGPLRSALSYHPVGSTLFETLISGIPEPGGELNHRDDPCPWERAELPDPEKPAAVRGICSHLTARSQHAILLVPDLSGSSVVDCYVTWAYRESVPSPPDPYLIWQVSQAENPYPRRAEAGRSLWRDLDALQPAAEHNKGSDSRRPRQPQIFRDLPAIDGLRVQALGFDQDGQAKDTQFVSGLTPPSFTTEWLRAQGQSAFRLGDLRSAAEAVGGRLAYAAKKAWSSYSGEKLGDCAWSERAAARYWPAAEDEFWRRLEAGSFDDLRLAFRRIAEPIYDEITKTAAANLRGARAVEAARFELYGGRPKKTAAASKERRARVIKVYEPTEADRKRQQFVRGVINQCEDRYHPGIRATLRSGLGKQVDRVPKQVHQYVIKAGLPDTEDEYRQHAHYAVAAMIAAVPSKISLRIGLGDGGARRDFGRCLADAVLRNDLQRLSAENALGLLAKQSTRGLHRHLPAVVGRLTDRPGAMDWSALLADLEAWPERQDQIARRWLQSFYRTLEYAARAAAEQADDSPAPDSPAA